MMFILICCVIMICYNDEYNVMMLLCEVKIIRSENLKIKKLTFKIKLK